MLLDTPICDFGWKGPGFKLKDPDGREFSSADLMGENGLLMIFMCNHCPYVKAITQRLAADTKILTEMGVGVVGIMSNDYRDYAEDSPPNMKRFAAEHQLEFPYLVDEDQSVGKAYGAVCTPDFFGFNREFELQYRGRLDDVGMGAGAGNADNRSPELLSAMKKIAETGSGPAEQTPSMGCSIKWS